MAKPDEDENGEEWVIGTWHCYYHLELHCVIRIDDKPRPDYHPGSSLHQWFKWNTYHAARKYQRAHPELSGYIIFNLSAARRQYQGQRDRR